MPDPTAPGWRPEYTGRDLGDVGSGRRLGAHLYYLYRAGRNELPTVAATYANLTRDVHAVAGGMRVLFTLPVRGLESSHLRLLELRDETHDVLRQTALRMQEAGRALVETAEDYAATDEAATAVFAGLLEENADDYRTSPPYVPDPPGVDDPPPEQQHIDDGHLVDPSRHPGG